MEMKQTEAINIESTTPKGCEGCGISYSEEQLCGEQLLKILPNGWKVSFDWCQVLFSDVQYHIHEDKKLIEVLYNSGLSYWWRNVIEDMKTKHKKLIWKN